MIHKLESKGKQRLIREVRQGGDDFLEGDYQAFGS